VIQGRGDRGSRAAGESLPSVPSFRSFLPLSPALSLSFVSKVYFEGHDDVLGGSDPTMGEIAFFFQKP